MNYYLQKQIKIKKIMKIETKPVYACEYCNKMSRSKGAMIRHEAACHKTQKIGLNVLTVNI